MQSIVITKEREGSWTTTPETTTLGTTSLGATTPCDNYPIANYPQGPVVVLRVGVIVLQGKWS